MSKFQNNYEIIQTEMHSRPSLFVQTFNATTKKSIECKGGPFFFVGQSSSLINENTSLAIIHDTYASKRKVKQHHNVCSACKTYAWLLIKCNQ